MTKDTKKFVDLLETCKKNFESLLLETKDLAFANTQGENDLASLCSRISKKEEELARLDSECKSRMISFEASLDKIRKQIDDDMRRAASLKEQAQRNLEASNEDRKIAEQLRKSSEIESKTVARIGVLKKEKLGV